MDKYFNSSTFLYILQQLGAGVAGGVVIRATTDHHTTLTCPSPRTMLLIVRVSPPHQPRSEFVTCHDGPSLLSDDDAARLVSLLHLYALDKEHRNAVHRV